MVHHRLVTGFSIMRQRKKELQTDKPPRPLNRGRVWIDCSASLLRHVRSLRTECLADRVGMTAEEHAGPHGYGKPFMGIARNGVCLFNSVQIASQPGQQYSGCAP